MMIPLIALATTSAGLLLLAQLLDHATAPARQTIPAKAKTRGRHVVSER